MDKPVYLLPFIFIYKIFAFFVVLPYKIVKYFLLGFFAIFYVIIYIVLMAIATTLDFIISYLITYPALALYKALYYFFMGVYINYYIFYKLSSYFLDGFIYFSYFCYRIFKYSLLGVKALTYPFVYLANNGSKNYKKYSQTKREESERRFKEKQMELLKRREERIKKEEELKIKRVQLIAERKKRKENDTYTNDKVVIEKKKVGDYINDFLKVVINVPAGVIAYFKNMYNNSSIVKNSRNKHELEREALLSSIQQVDDTERSAVKQLYQYTGKNIDGIVVKGYFDAYSRVEVHSFLLSEGFEVYSITTNEWIKIWQGLSNGFKIKIKTRDLVFFLTQLSTYIKAGIPLVEALKILLNQFKSQGYQRIFRSLIYDLTMGDSFSEALTKQGDAFPKILINMVKAAEMTGQLPEVLDDMGNYFTQIDKTRKQMVTIMMYPAIIFIMIVGVSSFILIYVIPKFVQIYASMDSAQIPGFTLAIIAASEFLQVNFGWMILGIIVFVLLFAYLYKNVKLLKTAVQWILMHIPAVGNIIIYNEVTMFSKTFSSLLAHNVFITDSMDILKNITNNEIYRMLILDTITNLAKGEKISESFKHHWAFPLPAYEMIVTGEKTGELPEMMAKVSDYYQELHANSIARIKTFIEPLMIVFLTFMVGGIVLSIVIPMFNMYQTIQA